MTNQNESGNPGSQVETPRTNRWTRLVGYIDRKLQERKTKKQNENSVDKAARRTATATIWMALLTFILAVAG